MQLESMWVHGLRRFGGEKPTRLRLDAPLVCLVGANEVGKSTLLDALEMSTGYIDEDDNWIPIEPTEWTRGETLPPNHQVVRLRYRLEKTDLEVLRALEGWADMRQVHWLERILLANGSSFLWLDPTPIRNIGPRKKLAATLRTLTESDDWPSEDETEGTPASPSTVQQLLEALESDNRSIRTHLSDLGALADALEEQGWGHNVLEEFHAVHALESRRHPHDEARTALEHLVPRFVRFEPQDRQLADEYDLTSAASDPPPALKNLAELAELDLELLLTQIQSGITGSVRATIDRANEVLREKFAAWTQKPPVTVSFDRSGTTLLIHVQSGSGVPMKPKERSEGLRQFVGLVALTAGEGHDVPPILLIDEAEMHLHYDAQADLMEVLAKQTTAAQVIYTTHSSACLPEDLGSSVRVVTGVRDEMLSEVKQQFWSDDVGLVPLLLAMGAGSMAFVPLRPAVIAEGGSDLVLLPSLIKEAARIKRLGYQVVPGAAGTPPMRIAGLDLHGVNTVWVLDGDESGVDRRSYLAEQGVPEDRIHLFRSGGRGIELEDLVHPATYCLAVNNYAQDLGGSKDEFEESLLPAEPCRRHDAVSAWCHTQNLKEPGKTAIANKVLELRGSEPLTDPDHREALRELHKELRQQLKVR
ncbi:MAG TPA: AAA family ATPase [Solirubrobacterales bacterium]|nr:AAA family ATPase [Solirubrobacterales bacterium]